MTTKERLDLIRCVLETIDAVRFEHNKPRLGIDTEKAVLAGELDLLERDTELADIDARAPMIDPADEG